MAKTQFTTIYDRFLGRVTDDMFVELSLEDTMRELQNLLLDAIPKFEFPRQDLFDYTINTTVMNKSDVSEDDFVIGEVWEPGEEQAESQKVLVENSCFNIDLTSEEINILAILMMCGWVQRQVTSIENTRMKYSGTDFKMTSQANHLQKMITLLKECQYQSHHMQRLYKRRKFTEEGKYRSNWAAAFGRGKYYENRDK